MKINKTLFGKFHDEDVYLYELTNSKGFRVKVMSYGATITQILLPDNTSISCGFDTLEEYFGEEYRANAPYFGCTVGRYCSQIKDAKFTLAGTEYPLAKNCGENNLHGGAQGFDKRIWCITENEETNSLCCTLKSEDMEEGYPGEVMAEVVMELTEDNEIKFSYSATTTKDTPLSMTNHSYFNLSGFASSVEDFEVELPTYKLMACDESGAATGEILDVRGTANDLTTARKIKDIESELGDGMEHFYVYDNPFEDLRLTARIEDKASGRAMEVFSTEPCMLFYTAKHMSNKLQRNENEKFGKTRAFACETHRWQNGVNIEGSPRSFTAKNETFKSQTIFKFKL